MAALVGLCRRIDQRRRLPRPRVYRDRLNPLEMRTDDKLLEIYRFRRPSIIYICDTIADTVSHGVNDSTTFASATGVLEVCGHWGFSPACWRCRACAEGHGWTMHPESCLGHRQCCRKINPLSDRLGGLKREKEVPCHRKKEFFHLPPRSTVNKT